MSKDTLDKISLDLKQIDKEFWETVEYELNLYLNTENKEHKDGLDKTN